MHRLSVDNKKKTRYTEKQSSIQNLPWLLNDWDRIISKHKMKYWKLHVTVDNRRQLPQKLGITTIILKSSEMCWIDSKTFPWNQKNKIIDTPITRWRLLQSGGIKLTGIRSKQLTQTTCQQRGEKYDSAPISNSIRKYKKPLNLENEQLKKTGKDRVEQKRT